MPLTPPPPPQCICTSAPGKVILLGEHAVVYGHPAVAASLDDLRVTVWLTPSTDQKVRIQLVNLQVDTVWNVSDICECPAWPLPPEPHVTAATVAKCLPQKGGGALSSSSSSHEALVAVLYLLRTLIYVENKTNHGLELCVTAPNLPVGAGLGSSAAFSVALAAAFWRLQQQRQQPSHYAGNGTTDLNKASKLHENREVLDVVNQYAFYAEILLHGQPSGVDNAVACYGGALQCVKDLANAGKMQWETLPAILTKDLHVLLVQTHVPRSTKALVAHVRHLHNQYPLVIQPVLQAMGALVAAWRQDGALVLPTLVRLNHALLQAVEVSHPALDEIVSTTAAVNARYLKDAAVVPAAFSTSLLPTGTFTLPAAVAAKLTGAGGGGCAFVTGTPVALLHEVAAALPASYTTFFTPLGGPGVLWHDDDKAQTLREELLTTPSNKR